jgi:hypothetical protein
MSMYLECCLDVSTFEGVGLHFQESDTAMPQSSGLIDGRL